MIKVLRPLRRAAPLLAGVLLAVSACAPAPEGGGGDGGPRDGGTLTYLLSGEVMSLDPATFTVPSNPSFLAPRALAIFGALAVENPATGDLDMRIARSIESSDSLHWTLKLRPDVRFSDGTTLDAAAVKFNWERLADPAEHAPMGRYARLMASMKVRDAQTLDVTLKAPDSAFPRVVAESLTYIGSPKAIRAKGEKFGERPVGAGPYRVEEFVRNDHLTLVRNTRYYGTTHLDRIVIKPVVDETQRLNTLKSDGADAMYSSDPNTAARAKDAGDEVAATTLNGGSDIMFNVKRAPFDDVRARKAVAYALDRRALSKELYGGEAPTVSTVFVKNSAFHDASIKQVEPSRKRAQKLFDELAADGKPLQAEFVVPQSFSRRAEWFQAQLATYEHVSVKLRQVPDAQAPGICAGGAFQAAFLASTWVYPAPSLTGFYGTGGTQNWGGYSDETVDESLEGARASQDEDVQKKAYARIQRRLVGDVPSVFYTRSVYMVVHSKRVHDVRQVGSGSPLWTSMWVSE
jgi:peptide/nickel transport system substrate-binding protein